MDNIDIINLINIPIQLQSIYAKSVYYPVWVQKSLFNPAIQIHMNDLPLKYESSIK